MRTIHNTYKAIYQSPQYDISSEKTIYLIYVPKKNYDYKLLYIAINYNMEKIIWKGLISSDGYKTEICFTKTQTRRGRVLIHKHENNKYRSQLYLQLVTSCSNPITRNYTNCTLNTE